MNKGTAALIGGILGIIAGAFFTWFLLKQLSKTSSSTAKTIENIESWEMWEDEKGHLHAVVHRKVTPVD